MAPADFDAWTRLVQAKGVRMTPETYHVVESRGALEDAREALGAGAERMPPGVIYFSGVSPGLFGARPARPLRSASPRV
jgi:predicted alpha/beta-fold hydrolase